MMMKFQKQEASFSWAKLNSFFIQSDVISTLGKYFDSPEAISIMFIEQ